MTLPRCLWGRRRPFDDMLALARNSTTSNSTSARRRGARVRLASARVVQNTQSCYISIAHSLLGAIDVAVSIMGSVCRPFIAKVNASEPLEHQVTTDKQVQIADHVSRPWAYLFSLVFYVLGYIVIASSKTVNAFAAGQVGIYFNAPVLPCLHRLCSLRSSIGSAM